MERTGIEMSSVAGWADRNFRKSQWFLDGFWSFSVSCLAVLQKFYALLIYVFNSNLLMTLWLQRYYFENINIIILLQLQVDRERIQLIFQGVNFILSVQVSNAYKNQENIHTQMLYHHCRVSSLFLLSFSMSWIAWRQSRN